MHKLLPILLRTVSVPFLIIFSGDFLLVERAAACSVFTWCAFLCWGTAFVSLIVIIVGIIGNGSVWSV